MRIISQDKAVDISYEQSVLKCIKNDIYDFEKDKEAECGFLIVAKSASIYEDDYYELGRYETKERALEVMEEIRKRYADFNFSNCCHFNMDKAISVKAIQVIGGMFINNCIYEMPKE